MSQNICEAPGRVLSRLSSKNDCFDDDDHTLEKLRNKTAT